MSETAVMTLRLPKAVKRDVERLAARTGHKPAQLGARLIEEGLRRRDFPQIELRETAAGRVAYLAGTRFTVCWIAGMIPGQLALEAFAQEYDLIPDRVRAALAYAQTFPDEMRSEREHAEGNWRWIDALNSAAHRPPAVDPGKRKGKRMLPA